MSEFFALAHAMEMDAAARYTETARQLRQQGVEELADLFDHLAESERGHVQQVETWAEQREANAIDDSPWPIPDTFDAPPEELARSRLVTPYQALASAVRHEERSFAFWTYVAAQAERGDVKDAAERMALEELGHVALLRKERRKAFHAERQDPNFGGRSVTLSSLAALERRLADLIEQHPDCAAGSAESAASLATTSRSAAAKLDDLVAARPPRFTGPTLPAHLGEDIAAISEYLAEAYLALAEASREGPVLSAALDLAGVAVYRLGALYPERAPRAAGSPSI
jgi:rubrerythrin